jgi:hypothetical protein
MEKITNWKTILTILEIAYETGEKFKYKDVDELVSPVLRRKNPFYSSEKSFKGTVLADLQKLRKLNYLKFYSDEGEPGVYSLT